MSGAGAGLFSALAVMLGVAVLARALARRLGWVRPAARGRLRMEVVQRLALSPKQGLAVVRIGDRLMTVSLGDGGVRPVLELGDAERDALAASASAETQTAPAPLRPSLDSLVPVLAGHISRGATLLRKGARRAAEDAEGGSPSLAPQAEPAPSAAFSQVMDEVMSPAESAEPIVIENATEVMEPNTLADQEMEIVSAPAVETSAVAETIVEPVIEVVAEPVVETATEAVA
ncbi:flagellar biosynthetic protein FliO, partial [Longimicrobium sp.]|uniref:flagellar biosynthetic protein FliO n=1 Tax=Longimicrobium sp. TaxID=2029185 RepID=UPI002E355BD8